MKTAIWCGSALLAILWTAGAWVMAELTQTAAQLVASGAVADLSQAAAQWPSLGWLAAWGDPVWLQWMQDMMLRALRALHDSLPFVGSVLSWLVPLVWIAWGLGCIVLLALTALALWLRARFAPAFQTLRSASARN